MKLLTTGFNNILDEIKAIASQLSYKLENEGEKNDFVVVCAIEDRLEKINTVFRHYVEHISTLKSKKSSNQSNVKALPDAA